MLKRRTTPSARVPNKSKFRSDIQGLRALAVTVVIADHLLHWPSGGFVGVDIFFVISGFLITGLLLREHEKTSKISFADFYRRRIRRILPVAAVVLIVTVSAAWMLLSAARAKSVSMDALWSMFFGANWHLAMTGTNYMDATSAPTPLQHFWSLAVEEQFYIVWPWLILALYAVGARRAWGFPRTRRALGLGMGLVAAVSFGYAYWETAVSPAIAYFSTFSRAWELAVGALLALFATSLAKMPDWVRPVLAYAGLGGIMWSVFAISPTMAFPAPWAAVPVLATSLVIGAGTGGDQKFLAPLTNPVAHYIGNISYSLYLWHFPVIVLGQVFFRDQGLFYVTIACVLMTLLSVVSYHLVEDPIRQSSWLEPANRNRRSMKPLSFSMKGQIAGLCLLALAAGVTTGFALDKERGSASVAQGAPNNKPLPQTTSPAEKDLTAEEELAAKVGAATRANVWPDLKPTVDELTRSALAEEWSKDGCLGLEEKAMPDPRTNAQRCSYGAPDAPKTAVVLGDSVAISYVPGIRAALEPQGYKVLVYTMQQCPAAKVSVLKLDKSPHPQCDTFRDWTWSKVAELHPDLLFMTSVHSPTLASGAEGPKFLEEWGAGYSDTFRALSGTAKRTVVLDPPPGGVALKDCATRISKPQDCKTTVTNRYLDLQTIGRQKLDEVGNETMEFVATKNWFCTTSGDCPSFVGTTPVYADGSHLTAAYSASLGPLITEVLKLAA